MQAARMRNEAAAEVGGRRTIPGQFAAQAGAPPDAAAVVCAVLLGRCLHLPVALLGILEAGGAWLLLDPATPPGRLAQLLAAARPAAVLVQRSLARRLAARGARLLVPEDARTA